MLNEPSTDKLIAVREKMRQSINEITAELNSALVKAELAYPVYLCVPASGDALATIACPLDPDEQSWNEIVEIVCRIVEKKDRRNTAPRTSSRLRNGWYDDGRSGCDGGMILVL
jgi:hypothetical protein